MEVKTKLGNEWLPYEGFSQVAKNGIGTSWVKIEISRKLKKENIY